MKNYASAVAIIGMDCRFPGAADVRSLWDNLCNEVESVTRIDRELLLAAGRRAEDIDHPDYLPFGAMLDDHDCFDAAFFNIAPSEARRMDPQQRLLLQCGWRALEDAGYAPRGKPQRVGVFVGSGGLVTNALWDHADIRDQFVGRTGGSWHVGYDKDFVPARLSYKLDLTGPSVALQSACSTSLVAVHSACGSLARGECEIALAGASNVRVPQVSGYLYEKNSIYSRDGHVRPFDAAASGVVFGSGVGLVVLKPLEPALADGDAIYAVIRGSAINNDGGNKMSFLSTKVRGQVDCMRMALKDAEVDASSISYIEAHGTGTLVGDPLETQALAQVFGHKDREGVSPAREVVKIGSVKGNLGHLDTAAGIAGLIKVALSLKYRTLPASINCTTLNSKVDLGNGALEVCRTTSAWTHNGGPRRAGINCLGIGGTNAFMVLEEAPASAVDASASSSAKENSNRSQLIVLSAKSHGSLLANARSLLTYLVAQPEVALPQLAGCLYCTRDHFDQRLAFVAGEVKGLIEQLERYLLEESSSPAAKRGDNRSANHSPLVLRMLIDAIRHDELCELRGEHLRLLAVAYCDGSSVDLTGLFESCSKLNLPGYQFERVRH